MTFVDGHQAAFAAARRLRALGARIRNSTAPASAPTARPSAPIPARAATDPLACGRPASEYRPYAPRARWVRTANDSYFTAMTYPQGPPAC